MSQKPRRSHTGVIAALLTLIVIMIAATGLVIWMCIDLVNSPVEPSNRNEHTVQRPVDPPSDPGTPEVEETEPPETTMPEPEHVVSTATVLSTGDLLMHKPIIDKASKGNGAYDFDPIFQYASDYISEADYALANLETTLAGTAKPYQGFPFFNCPDEIVTDAKEAGFDMMLTANNHSFDTGWAGYVRTLEVTRAAGLETLGTMATAEEDKYLIKEINGIKIGLLCYTYETSDGSTNRPSLNGNPMYDATYDNINCYSPQNPQRMYNEVEQYLAEMKAQGVEGTIMYIHWGPNEYELQAKDSHTKIAQKFCDLGIDVVVGGHPHVVQPMELLTSNTDPEHKTIVLHSMGNAVSNQRLGNLQSVKTAHTEDGVLFSVTFCKYSDGTVYVEGVELIPTWVNLDGQYYILPLDIEKEDQWQKMFDINESTFNRAKNSYDRTMALVGEGLEACQTWLAQEQAERDAYYLDLVQNPEKYATEPAETVSPETEAPVETTAAAA